MRYVGHVIRPPSEADSLILQATIGCAHNRCTFCGTYRDEPFRLRDLDELFEDIAMARRCYGEVRRIFLADGDAIVMPSERLLRILVRLKETFPELQRVGIYARATDVLMKSGDELTELYHHGLKILYVGLESGADRVLRFIEKGYTSEEAIEGCLRAQKSGMKLSTIILLGVGGKEWSSEHARESARMINEVKPRYLSVLTLMVLKGTPLAARVEQGEFSLPGPEGMLEEMKLFIDGLTVDHCIFRSNHASNYVALSGTLRKDKQRLMALVEQAHLMGAYRPDFFRAL
ncbi:MAG: radical SAM protein [Candidatus Eremiobacteraeota bacterium]|nr:radical SAM protein [Candidatus Eremiobacteraeota bacterium]